ncbi:MAG: nickel/cobalt transporter [Alphaproteobacteria bacterium]
MTGRLSKIGLLAGAFSLLPALAHACAYHAMFANLTFGRFVMALLDYFQTSATAAMVAAAAGVRDGSDLSPLVTALAFGFGYGALHALGPGHGKLIISSYFLGQDGKMKEGLIMGTQIAIVHVASAIVIVWAAHLLLSNVFASETADYRYVRLASYAAITGIGLYMAWGAAKKVVHYFRHHRGSHGHHHSHADEGGCACAAHEKLSGGEGKKRSFISVMVGVVPCTGAILVMLFALANDMVFLGTLVVVAISIGMAATMAGLGMASVWLRRSVLDKTGSNGVMVLNLEMLGALLIVSIGAGLFALTI